MKKIYIASPYSHTNPAVRDARFKQAACYAGLLMGQGHIAFSPIAHSVPVVRNSRAVPDDLTVWMRQDLPFVEWCDELHQLQLDGWEDSVGCYIERRHADVHGKKIVMVMPPPEVESIAPAKSETILEEAERLVAGDRQRDYSHPMEDFTRTGRIWGALLERWAAKPSEPVPPQIVGMCMTAVKMSREVHRHKRDNLVDGCGYLRTVDMIENYEITCK